MATPEWIQSFLDHVPDLTGATLFTPTGTPYAGGGGVFAADFGSLPNRFAPAVAPFAATLEFRGDVADFGAAFFVDQPSKVSVIIDGMALDATASRLWLCATAFPTSYTMQVLWSDPENPAQLYLKEGFWYRLPVEVPEFGTTKTVAVTIEPVAVPPPTNQIFFTAYRGSTETLA